MKASMQQCNSAYTHPGVDLDLDPGLVGTSTDKKDGGFISSVQWSLLLAVNVHRKGHWFAVTYTGFVSFICMSVVIGNLLFYRHNWLGTSSHVKLPAFLFIQDVMNAPPPLIIIHWILSL